MYYYATLPPPTPPPNNPQTPATTNEGAMEIPKIALKISSRQCWWTQIRIIKHTID